MGDATPLRGDWQDAPPTPIVLLAALTRPVVARDEQLTAGSHSDQVRQWQLAVHRWRTFHPIWQPRAGRPGVALSVWIAGERFGLADGPLGPGPVGAADDPGSSCFAAGLRGALAWRSRCRGPRWVSSSFISFIYPLITPLTLPLFTRSFYPSITLLPTIII